MLQATNFHPVLEIASAALLGSKPNCLQALFRKQPVEHLATGQSLFFEGDAAKHLFEVVEGNLRIFRIISDGRRVITGFLHAGDIVGVSLKNHYLYSAEAVTDTKVRRFSRKAFEAEISNSPELRPEVFARLRDEMAAAQDQMVLLSCKDAEERLCSFLLKQLRRDPGHCRSNAIVELPMTRLDMADYLGLTIETVSRTMTKLTNKGVLMAAGRHCVRIMKYATLVQLSGDHDEYDSDESGLIAYAGRQRQ
ncbi:Crp/Fnr family transcriptional regulator [Rhizobium leguminosarum]|uniref:Crp/Fnr family transcriptional regulator n=1 Tax=Rhizobium leguminosarum TaxID=384 RepID=UPI00102F5A0F|nr:cyclic nucleotide-binding domain-containing protein [Rhizobium leguminosarum]QIO75956.1 helix-turn-helix domain-containing protein [Rhizobium leguminosarum bv. trifolii]QIO82969.1 helix-turn-helix domain-containing protein [Rhizobium leguminosarum bv. trifolii]TAX45007.1 cyclic nucleotide-binding domain-containing protein [Rhizobium leguminosarum]TBY14342.1 cyclic nucleotide-binding domain-containing protein [Rhizobium leguminosarum bv. viciae]TBY17291.1 cyclic nucleotide-binding domain-con